MTRPESKKSDQSTKKISVTLKIDLYDSFDAYCKENLHSKSPLTAKLIADFLDREQKKSKQPRLL